VEEVEEEEEEEEKKKKKKKKKMMMMMMINFRWETVSFILRSNSFKKSGLLSSP
jgi:hypothetical protein